MKNIIHSGQFTDHDGNTIKVSFYGESNTSVTNDLKFAGKLPVVINRSGGDSDMFAPLRSTSCDICVVSNKILSDLYTNDKKGIEVQVEKLTADEQIRLFEGYMTPNTYTQQLSPNLDNIDMTAIDTIATLKYLYVDDLLEKAKTITMGELIAKALAMVKINANALHIENVVKYNGTYNFADLVIQTSNFWDEGDDPSSVYDAISECLRLFGYTMSFTGETYMIYSTMAGHDCADIRTFTNYTINSGGTLTYNGLVAYRMIDRQFRHSNGDWTTIDDNTTVSIDNTYDKIVGVASTKIPNYSQTAFDLVSSDERDKYDAGDVNVQRNKIKGFKKSGGYDNEYTNDEWYYLWNGVYIAPDYGLSISGSGVNGYVNMNGAYAYMTGQTGYPNAYGGILNFYGGEANPVGTGKNPSNERVVDIKECITVFAPDNGVAPEFLERTDLKWSYKVGQGNDGEDYTTGDLTKDNSSNSKFGTNKTSFTDAVSYSQKYENITISEDAEQMLVIDLSQSYSRTGIRQIFDTYDYSTMENKNFKLVQNDDSEYWGARLISGTAYTYPWTWRSDNISVSSGYFDKYDSGEYNMLKPVWDKRMVILSVSTPNKKYQFNGKEWVETTYITKDKAFYLKKLMNYEKIFKDDFQYDLIECADGTTYSLDEDGFTFYSTKKNKPEEGGVYPEGEGEDNKNEVVYEYYAKSYNDWKKYIDEADVGRLAIILPAINCINATVNCDIYHSSLLGKTGNSSHSNPSNTAHWVNYKVSGNYSYTEDNGDVITQSLTSGLIGDQYGIVGRVDVNIGFMPINATYVKAEHLTLDISLSVPESNLGQMFGESDIKYSTNYSKKFRESYDAPTFQVNTKHPIVAQSHSYIIAGDAFADANNFTLGVGTKKVTGRPENYVMQGYKNYYSVIRRTYNRVLVPNKNKFSNVMCYIEAPDIPNTGHGKWLMVLSDSYDVKTNRHTIVAVEDYNLNVNEIENYTVVEIPREARNPRYNLPSVQKKKVKE